MFRALKSASVWALMGCLAVLPTPAKAGEPYDMMKCLEEGRYCYDGDDSDIFDAILGIDPKKICSCHDNPPPRDNAISPFVGIRWHLVPGTFDLAVVSPTVFDEVRITLPPELGDVNPVSLGDGWSLSECDQDRMVLEGPPTLHGVWRFAIKEETMPVVVKVEVRSSLGTPQEAQRASGRELDPMETTASGTVASTTAESAPLPEPDWDLGSLLGGKTYNTTVTAKNISCPGKHRFSVRVEGEPWLRITGLHELEKIKIGKSKTTEAVVDLRDRPPGEYRNRLLIDCLTCPASCSQDIEVLDVRVVVVP